MSRFFFVCFHSYLFKSCNNNSFYYNLRYEKCAILSMVSFFFLFIHYKKSSLHFVQKWRIISNEYDISVSLKKKPFKTRARFQYPQIQKRSLSIIHAFFSFFRFFLKLNYPYENSTPSFYIYIYIDKYCNKISSYQNLNRINSLPLFVSHHRR